MHASVIDRFERKFSTKFMKSGAGADACPRMRRLKARLTGLHMMQARFPVLLQVRGNQTIVGVADTGAFHQGQGHAPSMGRI